MSVIIEKKKKTKEKNFKCFVWSKITSKYNTVI